MVARRSKIIANVSTAVSRFHRSIVPKLVDALKHGRKLIETSEQILTVNKIPFYLEARVHKDPSDGVDRYILLAKLCEDHSYCAFRCNIKLSRESADESPVVTFGGFKNLSTGGCVNNNLSIFTPLSVSNLVEAGLMDAGETISGGQAKFLYLYD